MEQKIDFDVRSAWKDFIVIVAAVAMYRIDLNWALILDRHTSSESLFAFQSLNKSRLVPRHHFWLLKSILCGWLAYIVMS